MTGGEHVFDGLNSVSVPRPRRPFSGRLDLIARINMLGSGALHTRLEGAQ
jgi:hypothetical protein